MDGRTENAIEPNTSQPLDGPFDYITDPTDAPFLGPAKNFNVIRPIGTTGADTSTHATFSGGQWLYSHTFSIAHDVMDIDALLDIDWLKNGLMRYTQTLALWIILPGNEILPRAPLATKVDGRSLN